MTKQQLKILKFLYKNPQTLESVCNRFGIPQNVNSEKYLYAFGDDFYNYVDLLRTDDHFKSTLKLNIPGMAYVEVSKDQVFHQRITYAFSTIALIVSIIALIRSW